MMTLLLLLVCFSLNRNDKHTITSYLSDRFILETILENKKCYNNVLIATDVTKQWMDSIQSKYQEEELE